MAGSEAQAAGRSVASLGRSVPNPAEAGRLVRSWFVAGLAQEAEQRRLFPWLAVAFGAGTLVCLTAADGLPAWWAPLAAGLLSLAGLPLLKARPVGFALLLGAALFFFGFTAAAIRLLTVAGPVLARTTIAPMTGTIESLDDRDGGSRLIVRLRSFGTLESAALPTRVRVSYRAATVLRPGDFIAASARLLPPPEAARPGGYDFARDAFFRGIGAVGSITGKIEIRPPPEPLPWSLRAAAAIDDARNALTRRIVAAIGGQAGAVAAALVTGKRGLINAESNDVLRSAGIYHVVTI